jgi:hypothetical protein
MERKRGVRFGGRSGEAAILSSYLRDREGRPQATSIGPKRVNSSIRPNARTVRLVLETLEEKDDVQTQLRFGRSPTHSRTRVCL